MIDSILEEMALRVVFWLLTKLWGVWRDKRGRFLKNQVIVLYFYWLIQSNKSFPGPKDKQD